MKKESFGIILPITLLAYFLILMDNSVIFTGSVQIGESLNLTDTSLAWVSNAYTLTFGGFLLLSGRLSDLLGRKRIFQIGLAIFGLSSLVIGLAQNASMMILARAIEGIGSSIIKPLLDNWIANEDIEPLLVVFPTYYPDRSFVVSNYSADYPLNHYFAETEVLEVMKTVESQYTTFAETADETGFTSSRSHRAFGGYSMGGITTWDVPVEQSDKFFYYMPMAGDSWIGQVTGRNSDEAIAKTLVSGLQENNYGQNDFQIIAMVGGSDGTKYSMIPQIEALRSNHSDLITGDNLIYWENNGGGHNQESFELEIQHGLTYLFKE